MKSLFLEGAPAMMFLVCMYELDFKSVCSCLSVCMKIEVNKQLSETAPGLMYVLYDESVSIYVDKCEVK